MIADEEVAQDARSIALGTIIYIVSPLDIIPDTIPDIGFVDDVIVVRCALEVIAERSGEKIGLYQSKYPHVFSQLPEELQILKSTLGGIYRWLRGKVEASGHIRYKGMSALEILRSRRDMENLCEESMVLVANY